MTWIDFDERSRDEAGLDERLKAAQERGRIAEGRGTLAGEGERIAAEREALAARRERATDRLELRRRFVGQEQRYLEARKRAADRHEHLANERERFADVRAPALQRESPIGDARHIGQQREPGAVAHGSLARGRSQYRDPAADQHETPPPTSTTSHRRKYAPVPKLWCQAPLTTATTSATAATTAVSNGPATAETSSGASTTVPMTMLAAPDFASRSAMPPMMASPAISTAAERQTPGPCGVGRLGRMSRLIGRSAELGELQPPCQPGHPKKPLHHRGTRDDPQTEPSRLARGAHPRAHRHPSCP